MLRGELPGRKGHPDRIGPGTVEEGGRDPGFVSNHVSRTEQPRLAQRQILEIV
jgi:hypothetical protein